MAFFGAEYMRTRQAPSGAANPVLGTLPGQIAKARGQVRAQERADLGLARSTYDQAYGQLSGLVNQQQQANQQGLGQFDELRSYVQGSQVNPLDMTAARNAARQAAVARGLEGPLAASLESEAQGRMAQAFEQQRYDRLRDLLGARSQYAQQGLSQLGGLNQSILGFANQRLQGETEQQWRERMLRLQLAQQAQSRSDLNAQNQANFWGQLAGAGLGLGGGIAGLILGGPPGAMAGTALGGAAGSALSGGTVDGRPLR